VTDGEELLVVANDSDDIALLYSIVNSLYGSGEYPRMKAQNAAFFSFL